MLYAAENNTLHQDCRYRKVVIRTVSSRGEAVLAPRSHIHTFRNSGKTLGRPLIFITPSGFEKCLEEIAPYSPATDMPKIIEIPNRYGITLHI